MFQTNFYTQMERNLEGSDDNTNPIANEVDVRARPSQLR